MMFSNGLDQLRTIAMQVTSDTDHTDDDDEGKVSVAFSQVDTGAVCEIECSPSSAAPTAYFLVPFTQSVNVVAKDESVTVRQLEGNVAVQTDAGGCCLE